MSAGDTTNDIMSVKKSGRFTDALEAYFTGVVLPQYVGKSINKILIEEMRNEVINHLKKIIHMASFKTHDDLVTWLGHEYFCAIELNELKLGKILGSIEPSLAAVPDEDLRRYAQVYRDTDIGDKLLGELARRSG